MGGFACRRRSKSTVMGWGHLLPKRGRSLFESPATGGEGGDPKPPSPRDESPVDATGCLQKRTLHQEGSVRTRVRVCCASAGRGEETKLKTCTAVMQGRGGRAAAPHSRIGQEAMYHAAFPARVPLCGCPPQEPHPWIYEHYSKLGGWSRDSLGNLKPHDPNL